jgi:hypothetical protein
MLRRTETGAAHDDQHPLLQLDDLPRARSPAMSAAASLLGSIDLMGWAAAGVTMMTFACQDMRRLRVLALLANAAFIAYGAMAMLLPVLVLHLILAPINLLRLWSLRRAGMPLAAAPAEPAPSAATRRPVADLPSPFRRRRAYSRARPARVSSLRNPAPENRAAQ